MKSSWKTTTCGILGLVASGITMVAIPLLDADPATLAQWGTFAGLAAVSIGAIFSRDNKVSSEDVGAK